MNIIKINENAENQRIDNFLFKTLKGVPHGLIYRLMRGGQIRVNKKRIKPEYRLKIDDEIKTPNIRVSEANIKIPPTRFMEILRNKIIYQDDNIVVLDKPSGVACHGGTDINFGVIETMRALWPKLESLELVHRLDKETSGCLLLAKRRPVLTELHELWRNGEIRKTYLVAVRGKWRNKKQIVDLPLEKNVLQSGERMVKVSEEGKNSCTEFHLVDNFGDFAVLKVILHTGRTHQIRVHAAYLGYPVLGDEKYGDVTVNRKMRKIGLRRMFLHAYALDFVLPSTKQKFHFEAELDSELLKFLQNSSK